ncbi:hypothetical protein ASZ90_017254 [hydrocarbon metagenome]|uniref:VCBS repeat-containing protein n=1 Tax=hydrocarbon metagenome TaxID=938273 RepID=A0A0W8E9N8_9ZZZZ
MLILSACIIWADRIGTGFFLAGEQPELAEHHDLNNDGHIETYILVNHCLKVTENESLLWQSPADWRVVSLVIRDATHDGREDLIMVVWKEGSFGEDIPFWIIENDHYLRCHLFIFNLVGEQVKPVWMSSALHRPIKSLQIKDINGNGKNELIVQEGSYSLLSSFINPDDSEPTIWQWKGWGFYLLD